MKKTTLALLISSTALATPFHATAADSISEALSGGEAKINFRLRHETVDEDNAAKKAELSSLRTRLNYKTASYKDFGGFIEFDNVAYIGPEERLDNKRLPDTVGEYSVIGDPDGSDLNQAYISYSGLNNTVIKAGRQRIVLDNQRFVGGVAWRQNEQTYDAISSTTKVGDLKIFYAYLDNINRIWGPSEADTSHPNAGNAAFAADWKSDSHLVNVNYKASPLLNLTGYAYYLDFEDSSAANSSKTHGVRATGSFGDLPLKPGYEIEYASQEDHGANPVSYEADYTLAALNFDVSGVKLKAGQESMGSDDDAKNALGATVSKGFATPLATLHKFDGFADKFLGTPADGVVNTFGSASYVYKGVKFAAFYHDFESDENDVSYGHEIDAVVSKKFGKVTALVKYADYRANAQSVDTEKLWLMLNATF